jgi:Ferritin-like domain
MSKLPDLQNALKGANRRNFVKKLGIAGAALGALSTAPKTWAQSAGAPAGPSDIDILNFALNLEYLEAEFYVVATTGNTLAQQGVAGTTGASSGTTNANGTSIGTNNPGLTTGGNMVAFTDPRVQSVAQELATDEKDHVALLQGAIAGLGGVAIAKPAINLAALGIGFASQNDFLTLSRAFEDIGVTAYGGAAPLIQNKGILGVAARVLATEAEHVGAIRLFCAQNNVMTMALDGVDHLPPPSGTQYFSTNSQALTETRTPGQVLYLAYGNKANATSGGFFPNGVNGNINMSSAAATATSNSPLTVTPNPIIVTGGATTGSAMICFNAPGVQQVAIVLNSPSGIILGTGSGSGCITTGPYLTNGSQIFLQDISNGKSLSAANTLASLVITVKSM